MKNPGLPTMFIEGRLTADPELRVTNSGKQVVSLTIAAGERKLNNTTNEWEDGEKLFTRCSAWDELAENISASLSKGDPVIARVRPYMRQYTTNDGTKGTSFEARIESIGVTLDRHTVAISKAGGGNAAGGGWANQGHGQQPSYGHTQDGGYGQPGWGSPAVQEQAEDGQLNGFDDEQPF